MIEFLIPQLALSFQYGKYEGIVFDLFVILLSMCLRYFTAIPYTFVYSLFAYMYSVDVLNNLTYKSLKANPKFSNNWKKVQSQWIKSIASKINVF